ncbi:hypothetical protein [Actinacidiphila glaucinigra]|uniref:hypothetical protein n=1 Tax=Actinacidiphila glaucinigra TaxID=235986 RepID=UPI003720B881
MTPRRSSSTTRLASRPATRHILTRALHANAHFGNGRPRRTGYALVPKNPITLQQIESALRSVGITLGPNALELLHRGDRVQLSGGEYTAMARAVLELLTPVLGRPAP